MPSGPPEFIPPFIPVTGVKCSYGKISSPLTEISVGKTEISGTEPTRPLIWTHRKFYKGFRGEARSRKPGQPGQPGSYEEALKLTKQQLCTCKSFFVHSPVTARLQRENALFHVFVEDVNTRQWLSSSFSELPYSLLEFNSRKNCQVLTSWMRENKCDQVWSSATSLFKPSLLLKLPIIQNRPRKRVTLRQDKQWKLALVPYVLARRFGTRWMISFSYKSLHWIIV